MSSCGVCCEAVSNANSHLFLPLELCLCHTRSFSRTLRHALIGPKGGTLALELSPTVIRCEFLRERKSAALLPGKVSSQPLCARATRGDFSSPCAVLSPVLCTACRSCQAIADKGMPVVPHLSSRFLTAARVCRCEWGEGERWRGRGA